ncbi:hypothetical protein Tco_1032264 [Tanacetum coccineum]|uniref:Uncharacterized protein n=1 Tax=Tanacetum coccineum TaxID=301880 RepID=A0ABQ5GCE9_9ASTR
MGRKLTEGSETKDEEENGLDLEGEGGIGKREQEGLIEGGERTWKEIEGGELRIDKGGSGKERTGERREYFEQHREEKEIEEEGLMKQEGTKKIMKEKNG